MHGDFSKFTFDPHEHDRGVRQPVDAALRNRAAVLQQQGRVITDGDLLEGELLGLAWQAQVGHDLIGARVCAVPASEPGGFRIEAVTLADGELRLSVRPGRAWIDGLLARLPGTAADPTAPVLRRAGYYGAPFAQPQPATGTIGEGVRDAVVLEAWHDVLHGFQHPEQLIEAALGGPDTSERAFLNFRFRLLRLGADEDCTVVPARLADDPAAKGRLGVTLALAPATAIGGECPVIAEGGYRGLEHHLYRIEIAELPVGTPLRFKWSPWNGGLVGRGRFDATGGTPRVVIDAGRSAILNAGLVSFYLEALQFDALDGRWRLSYASVATLNAAQDLELAAPPSFGSLPATTAPVFFRLWNELRDVAEFSNAADPVELRDGIQLVFEVGAAAWLQPGDHWVFPVRAGEIGNPAVLLDTQPPRGVVYHRVALAEIHWHGGGARPVTAEIEDCRKRFRPLTQQKACCSVLVGNGLTSFGDVNSLEEAAALLPVDGGELCLLPGVHRANLRLEGRHGIRIHGCSRRTLVYPRTESRTEPLLHVVDCSDIEVFELDLLTYDGIALALEGSSAGACRDLRVHDIRVVARRNAIRAHNVAALAISSSRLHLLDTPDGRAAISLAADDVQVERNTLLVLPFVDPTPQEPDLPDDDPTHDPADPCATSSVLYQFPLLLLAYAHGAWGTVPTSVSTMQPYRALSGIHLRPGCERVRIADNTVVGGAGHGITFGGDLDASEATPAAPQPVVRVNVLAGSLFLALLIDEKGTPVAGVDVFLEAQTVATDRSDAEGMVSISASPGQHLLTVAPAWRIVRAAESRDQDVLVTAVTLAPQAVLPASRGFIHELTIEANDISLMGLSAIGFGLRFGVPLAAPPVALPENDPKARFLAFIDLLIQILALTPLLRATDPVRDLTIRGNHLHHNLQAPFGPVLLDAAQVVGFGGISLAAVESVVISGNHVHENGPSAVNPVCGVFLGWASDADITDNVITNNGAITDDYEEKAQAGLRGGIFVRFAGALTTQFSASTGRKPAIRIHDNRIDQGAGRALTAYACGPVSVVNNHLNSEHTGRFGFVDSAVGGALVVNLGGLHRVLARTVANFFDDDGLASLAERGLPGGETLFDGNLLRVGIPSRSMMAALLLAMDDLGFAGNTSSVYRIDPLLGNVVLLADTVRATASRLREDARCTASITTRALRANMTSLNQADHKVFALESTDPNALITVAFPNHVLRPDDCTAVAPAQQTFAAFFDSAAAAHASELGGLLTAESFSDVEMGLLARRYSATSIGAVKATQVAANRRYLSEAARLSVKHGATHPTAKALQAQADAGAEATRLLAISAEAVQVQPPTPGADAAAISGRFVNARGQGLRDHVVALLRSNGSTLMAVGTTNVIGYFAATFATQEALTLEREGNLFVRVADFAGKEVLRTAAPIRIAPGANIQLTLTVPVRIVPRSVAIEGTVIFGEKGQTPPAPAPAPAPAPPVRTSLDKLGVDDALHKQLIEGSIGDVEGILETDPQKLAQIVGGEGTARKLIQLARRLLAGMAPAPSPVPTLRTPLDKLALDASTRSRLEHAGLVDVEAVLELPPAKLAEFLGSQPSAQTLRERAQAVLGSKPNRRPAQKRPKR